MSRPPRPSHNSQVARAQRPTLREIAEELARAPKQPIDVRFGTVNGVGQFFDPQGRLLAKDRAQLTPVEAAEHLQQGAVLAFEGCGCGGSGKCEISWITVSDAKSLLGTKPKFVKGFGSPTWIDLWRGDGSTVVFAHGDVEWGDMLPVRD